MKALFDKTKQTEWYVTPSGDVLSIRKNIQYQKKGYKHKRGYVYIRTSNGNYQLHRLVCSAFLPNPENKPCVNHKDGNKQNNSIHNLEWVTHKENSAHALKNNLLNVWDKNEGWNLKYTNEQCREVLKNIHNGMSYSKAGKVYNMPYSTVAHLARGSRRRILC